MLFRNLVIILSTAAFSLICYEKVQWNRRASTISEVLTLIERNYFEDVEPRTLFDGAMRGMIGNLDMNSSYLDPDQFQQFQRGLNQEFGGIGIMVEYRTANRRPAVIAPLVDTPAFRAGVQAGDVIMSINGNDTLDMPIRRTVELIHGKVGDPVRLGVQHPGTTDTVELSVPRAEIKTDSVLGDARREDASWDYFLQEDPRILYLRIVTFGERTVDEVRQALAAKHPVYGTPKAIVIDLRDNAGGLLTAAIGTSDLFINQGVIVSTRGRGGIEARRYEASSDVAIEPSVPVTVLVNQLSASASEILAACLQDHQRAVVVGQRSYGKGTVQNLIPLEGGRSGLKLTTASYWRPSGKNIHRGKDATEAQDWGVTPNPGFEVPLSRDVRRLVDNYRRYRDLKVPALPFELIPPSPDEVLAKLGQTAQGKTAAIEPAADADLQADEEFEEQETPIVMNQPPPAVDDPQLRKAIQHLYEKIGSPQR